MILLHSVVKEMFLSPFCFQKRANIQRSLEDFDGAFLFQLQEFIQDKLVPQFEDVIGAANSLRNSISKEAKQFGSVSLLALDRRAVEG